MSDTIKEAREMPMMFVHCSLDDAGLSLKAFRVLGHLHRRAYRDDRAFSSVDGMAKAINLHPNTVKTALAELVDAGFIVREPRPGTSSVYRPVKVSEWEREKGEGWHKKQAGGWHKKQATKIILLR
ncbi:MAG: hypothetical protein JWM59_716 [Verrucomicrobiales bacterium]|nr:hypothetical protein [Verrucomicrobiales bacterium]